MGGCNPSSEKPWAGSAQWPKIPHFYFSFFADGPGLLPLTPHPLACRDVRLA